MSRCCEVTAPVVAVDERCGRCGAKGRRVPRKTMESLLQPEALDRLAEGPYSFDRTPECDVVYFSNRTDSYFHKDDLVVRVGWKEAESPIPLCYCFGHTDEAVRDEFVATGRSTVVEKIAAEVQAGNCSCALKNPSGNCCLGDVRRALTQIRTEVRATETVAAWRKDR